MKKLLSLALTLALALGLSCPAWAVEAETAPLDEATVTEIAEKYGLDAPVDVSNVPDGDFGYSVKTTGDDPAADYMAAHPEEIAALDIDQLLADWGYEDINMTAEERFLEAHDYFVTAEGLDTAEALAKYVYALNRVFVEEQCEAAAEYRAEDPASWEAFDADSYFTTEYGDWREKDEYMAASCILTEEEFVDFCFSDYMDTYGDYPYYPETYDPDWWEELLPGLGETQQPTLTLMVNGVASEVEVTAENGVTYADAVALRQILGADAVPADANGSVAIRSAAEAAGWDVQWYNGGWRGINQEVQLWDRAFYENRLAEEFGPVNALLAQVLTQSADQMFSQQATAGSETVTLELTSFSTLDGDETYKLTANVDYLMQNGVCDMTITFDASALLKFFPEGVLDKLLKNIDAGFSAAQLSTLLKTGRVELILDYNEGYVAYNIPLLALIDETLAGWQYEYVSYLDGLRDNLTRPEELSLASTLYAQMLTTAQYSGAASALGEYTNTTAAMIALAGKDCFTTQNGKMTYQLTTRRMNQMMTAALQSAVYGLGGVDLPSGEPYSFFKHYDLSLSLDDRGGLSMNAHVRLDKDGIIQAIAAMDDGYDSYYTLGGSMIYGILLNGMDIDFTMTASATPTSGNQRVDIHWNNVGKLSLRTNTNTQTTTKSPRQVEDVVDLEGEEIWYHLPVMMPDI